MRYFSRFALAFVIAAACTPALAQFKFSIPGFGGGGNKGVDVGSAISNLKGLKEPNEADEIKMGQEFASVLLGAKPLLADVRIQRYVNTLGRWLAMQTERPDLPWTFGVLDDSGFNAFATPGGYIFITRGLLNRMNNEAELAGVLAHEIGHVLRKHHLHAAQTASKIAIGGNILDAFGKGGGEGTKIITNIVKLLHAQAMMPTVCRRYCRCCRHRRLMTMHFHWCSRPIRHQPTV